MKQMPTSRITTEQWFVPFNLAIVGRKPTKAAVHACLFETIASTWEPWQIALHGCFFLRFPSCFQKEGLHWCPLTTSGKLLRDF